MANGKKKWVAFKGNLTIPAAMAGKKEDLKVQSGEPVQVLAFYADSVVQDGIADYSDASAKDAFKKQASSDADAKVKIGQLESDLQTAKNELANAENDVSSLNAKLQASAEEVDGLKEKLLAVQDDLGVAEGLLAEGERSAAQTAVADAQTALDAAEGTDAASDARATLLAAQQALAALQG
jgi:chromosome segregation ATPase